MSPRNSEQELYLHQPQPKRPNISSLLDGPAHSPKVSRWLTSLWPVLGIRCRSVSNIRPHSTSSPGPRRQVRSAPATMSLARDADGYVVPLPPSGPESSPSVGSVSPVAEGITASIPSRTSSRRALVEDPHYRTRNLLANNISLCALREPLPERISRLVNLVTQPRSSPHPLHGDVRLDDELNKLWSGAAEPHVQRCLDGRIFPRTKPLDILQRDDRHPISRHAIPSTGGTAAAGAVRVSQPVPDMLYGYNMGTAFPNELSHILSTGSSYHFANTLGLMYPFLVIEIKGEGPSGPGNLWVATNQCLGGAAACVNLVERLNNLLEARDAVVVDSAAFSIAMSGTEARVYVSWKADDGHLYMASVDSFLLHKPGDYIGLRNCTRNIIEWGRNSRLSEIRRSLGSLCEKRARADCLEEDRCSIKRPKL